MECAPESAPLSHIQYLDLFLQTRVQTQLAGAQSPILKRICLSCRVILVWLLPATAQPMGCPAFDRCAIVLLGNLRWDEASGLWACPSDMSHVLKPAWVQSSYLGGSPGAY